MNAREILDAGLNVRGKVFDFTAEIEMNHPYGTPAEIVLDDLRGMLGCGADPEVVAFYEKLGVTA